MGLGKNLRAHHRWAFSGGDTSGSFHRRDVSPEAASGGTIALIEDGDTIAIDIPNRSIQLQLRRG